MVESSTGESIPVGRDSRLECLPEGFAEAMATELPQSILGHRQRRRILAGLRAFVTQLIRMAAMRRDDGWTPIHRDRAWAAFGIHNWHMVKDWLIAAEWIECNDSYVAGERSMGYRIGPRWQGVKVRRHRSHDRDFIRLYDAIRGRNPADPKPLTSVERHLQRWLDAFTFDPAEIERGLASIDGENPRHRTRKRTVETPDGVRVIRLKPRKRTPAEIESARRESASIIYALATEGGPAEREGERCRYQRFHSIATRMPRWMRRAILIDGRPLAELDVVGCQPLIQILLAAEWAAAQGTTPTPTTGTTPDTHTHCVSVSRLQNIPPDVNDWLRRYSAGEDPYRIFAGDIDRPEMARDVAKADWMEFAYDRQRPADPKWRRTWAAYSRNRPTIAAWLAETKARGGYEEAARECQRFESRTMIDGVVGYLAEHHPGVAILTVHDAILTHPENVAAVQEAIALVWLRDAGFLPRTKLKEAA